MQWRDEKHFKKELVIIFKKSSMKTLRPLINIGSNYIDTNVKIRDHCHITGIYRVSAHKDCNINLTLNHKIHILFHNLKNYDSHLVMQELRKLNLK